MYVEAAGFGALRRTARDPVLRSVPGFGAAFPVVGGSVSETSMLRSKVVNGLLYPVAVQLSDLQQAAVGAFVDGAGRPFCTGTLIDVGPGGSHVVLSAAHCGVEVGDRFVIGADAAAPAAAAFVASAARDGRWSGTAYDHLLARLDRDLPASPLPLTSTVPAIGVAAQGAGYGMVDPEVSDNTKRWWTAEPISAVSGRWIAVDGQGQRGLCLGDSGGPLLVNTPSGPAVAGTVSQGDVTCTGEDIYSRPDLAWIGSVVESWKTPGARPAKAWAPTAAAIVGAGLAAGILVAVLRR